MGKEFRIKSDFTFEDLFSYLKGEKLNRDKTIDEVLGGDNISEFEFEEKNEELPKED